MGYSITYMVVLYLTYLSPLITYLPTPYVATYLSKYLDKIPTEYL